MKDLSFVVYKTGKVIYILSPRLGEVDKIVGKDLIGFLAYTFHTNLIIDVISEGVEENWIYLDVDTAAVGGCCTLMLLYGRRCILGT